MGEIIHTRSSGASLYDLLPEYSVASLMEKQQEQSDDLSCLFDAHCHLSFAGNGDEVAASLLRNGICCFTNTVTPEEYLDAQACFESYPHIDVGLGLHPWWLLDGRCTHDDILLFEDAAMRSGNIGEIGLDFGRKYQNASDACQKVMVEGFERAVAACALTSVQPRVISLHSVRAAGMVLDILERWNCAREHACIFHWFSGTSDEMKRALDMGCWFSVSAHMLSHKKGRAYAKALPAQRILLETDAPSDVVDVFDAAVQVRDLQQAFQGVVALKTR